MSQRVANDYMDCRGFPECRGKSVRQGCDNGIEATADQQRANRMGLCPADGEESSMTEPALSDEETQILIDYARRKFAAERWPVSPALQPVREITEKLNPKSEPQPLPAPGKRVEASWRLARRRRR